MHIHFWVHLRLNTKYWILWDFFFCITYSGYFLWNSAFSYVLYCLSVSSSSRNYLIWQIFLMGGLSCGLPYRVVVSTGPQTRSYLYCWIRTLESWRYWKFRLISWGSELHQLSVLPPMTGVNIWIYSLYSPSFVHLSL